MARIILYKGQSQYGALRIHIDRLAQAFENIGNESVVIDFDESGAYMKLEKELNVGCNFLFSFNCIAADLKMEEESIYNVLNVPYIAAMVDHPIYHMPRLDNNIKKFVVTCLDHKHLNFLSEQYDENHFVIKSFLIPGGSESKLSKEESLDQFESNRNINMLFTGSFRGIPKKEWEEYENRTLANMMNDICDHVLTNEYVLVEDAFEYVVKQRSIEFSHDQKNRIKLHIMSVMKDYIASYKRYICLETLAKEGIHIDIYGIGFEEWAKRYKNIKYYEAGTVENTLDLLTKTKLCLNINNSFVAGGHERVFNSMINGAPVITDKSLFYDKEFEEGKDIITYSWTDLSRLPEKVNNYLNNTEALWNISKNARKKVQENYTWEHKARQIIELFELSMM
ncbi:glycosyltransferase family protein [Clostridium saccharoperbutylacetonicum]